MSMLNQERARALAEILEPADAPPAVAALPRDVRLTLDQLTSAVYGSEHYPIRVEKPTLAWIMSITLRRLGMAALGGCQVHVDLGTGYELRCELHPVAGAIGMGGA